MNKSPFSLNDFGLEKELYRFQPFEIVETAGFCLLEKLVRERVDAFIVGERGIGKSITAHGVTVKLLAEKQKVYRFAGERDLSTLYNELWILITAQAEMDSALKEEIKLFLENNRHVRIFEWMVEYCKYFSCRRKERCYFKVRNKFDPKYDEMMNHLMGIMVACPMKRYVIFSLLQFVAVIESFKSQNFCFILDIPSNFSRFDVSHFSELVSLLRRVGCVILLGNEKQHQLCSRSEELMKLASFTFPHPENPELVEMLRSKCRRAEYVLNASDRDLLKVLAYSSCNPRKMLNICSLCDNKLSLPPSSIGQLEKAKMEWVKVKKIRERYNEKYSCDLSVGSIGRVLAKMEYSHRCNPDSEYFINIDEIIPLIKQKRP